MKNAICLAIICLSLVSMEVFAWTFLVEGTNCVEVVFEDVSLSTSERSLVETDMQRLFEPSLSNATVIAERPSHPAIINETEGFELTVDPDFGITENRPSVSTDLERRGSNYILTVTSELTDAYKGKQSFFQTHSNAIVQAFAFAENLRTNSLVSRTQAELKNIRLSKKFAPGQDPDDDVSAFLSGFGNATFYLPSLLDFQMRASGPTNATAGSFLWGIIPYRDSQEISGLPIVFYQDRWWYSVWFWEEGDQTW